MGFLSRAYDPEKSSSERGANLKVYDLKGATPFSGMFTADKPAQNNKHRLRVFRKFFGWDTKPDGLRVLDIGRSNYISRHLGITENTQGNFNEPITKIAVNRILERVPDNPKTTDNLYAERIEIIPALDEQYDAITSFETFAHCMNPLILTRECHRMLKPGGSLYLSTPLLRGIAYFHGRGNFTEYKKDRILTIHQYCGFRPERYETKNPWMWWFPLYGFRPIVKTILNRFQLWQFIKE
jgi:SAM-dependent methyltransferase